MLGLIVLEFSLKGQPKIGRLFDGPTFSTSTSGWTRSRARRQSSNLLLPWAVMEIIPGCVIIGVWIGRRPTALS